VAVAYVSPTALGLDVTLDATNPNTVDLTAGNVSARVVVDKNVEMGVATVEQTLILPANQTTEMHVTADVPWTNVLALATLATSDRTRFPYEVHGTLELGGELIHKTVPFEMTGDVSRDQLLRATRESLPPMPGVNVRMVDGGIPLTGPSHARPRR
jgi:hypothetical protein